MSTNQRLGIDIIGTDKSSAAFASLTRHLTQAQGSVQKLAGTFKSLATGVLGGLSIASLGKALSGVSERLDDMGKAAQKIGVPVEQLSKLAYAAKLADVPMETLQTAMVAFSKGLSEFQATGKGDVGAALRALGISALQANGQLRGQPELLQEVAGKFAVYADSANKTALSAALFSTKAGPEMIPLLNGGRDAISGAADEATRFGLVVTNNAAASAEQFNDNLTRLQSAGQGLAQVIGTPLIGAFAGLVDNILTYIDIGGNAEGITGAIYDGFVQLGAGIRGSMAEIQKIVAIYSAAKDIFSGESLGPMGPVGRVNRMKAEIAAIDAELVKTNASAQQFSNVFGKGDRLDAKPLRSAPNPNSPIDVCAAADAAREKSLAAAAKAEREAAQEQKRAMSEAMSVFDQSRGPIEKYKDDLKQLDFLLGKGTISQAQYNDHVKNLRASFADAAPAVDEFGQHLAQAFGDEVKSNLDALISGTFKFKDALTSLISKFANLGIDNLFSALSSGFGGHPLYGGGGIGSIFSGLLGFSKGGTIFESGSSGIDSQVAMFKKAPSERVNIGTPEQLSAGGGTTVHNTWNIAANTSEDTVRLIKSTAGQMLNASIAGEPKRRLEHSQRFG